MRSWASAPRRPPRSVSSRGSRSLRVAASASVISVSWRPRGGPGIQSILRAARDAPAFNTYIHPPISPPPTDFAPPDGQSVGGPGLYGRTTTKPATEASRSRRRRRPRSERRNSQMPTSKSNEAVLAGKLAAGTQKRLSTIGQLIIGSGTFTPAQVVSELQSFASLRAGVDAAKAALKAALEDEKSKGASLRTFFNTFIVFVRAAFGNSPDILADFGLEPKKAKTPLTVAQKAAAAAKRKATREARGTKGTRQKALIKGAVTGVEITPVTASSPSAPATSNASSAAPTTGASVPK